MVNKEFAGVWIGDDGDVGAPDPYNLQRYVGNNPTNATDPTGLAAIRIDFSKPAKPDPNKVFYLEANPNKVYFDEYFFSWVAIENREVERQEASSKPDKASIARGKRFINAFTSMGMWKAMADANPDLLSVDVYYITPEEGKTALEQFLESAVKNGPGSFNLYFGHGAGVRGEMGGANARIVKGVEETLTKAKWEMEKVKELGPPRFAFSCCYGGWFNGKVPVQNRIPGSMDETNGIYGRELSRLWVPLMENVDKLIKERIGQYSGRPGDEVPASPKPLKTSLHIYFDEWEDRPPTAPPYPRDLSYRFPDWVWKPIPELNRLDLPEQTIPRPKQEGSR